MAWSVISGLAADLMRIFAPLGMYRKSGAWVQTTGLMLHRAVGANRYHTRSTAKRAAIVSR